MIWAASLEVKVIHTLVVVVEDMWTEFPLLIVLETKGSGGRVSDRNILKIMQTITTKPYMHST